jgi:FMN phosphatase YigB (HAD superfamily)
MTQLVNTKVKPMTGPQDTVFLFDVDNTLLNNDAVSQDFSAHLESEFGRPARERYWAIFETLRAELGYADYLGALQRYRVEDPDDPQLLRMAGFLIDYPFESRLFPGALKALAHCRRVGTAAILSDGDVVFQPRKITRSGLWEAVDGHVMIYLHKEQMLDKVERRYPAEHYVMVDDKLRLLDAMKKIWGERLTTVFVRQGHYALDLANISAYPAADVTLEKIGDLATLNLAKISGAK